MGVLVHKYLGGRNNFGDPLLRFGGTHPDVGYIALRLKWTLCRLIAWTIEMKKDKFTHASSVYV